MYPALKAQLKFCTTKILFKKIFISRFMGNGRLGFSYAFHPPLNVKQRNKFFLVCSFFILLLRESDIDAVYFGRILAKQQRERRGWKLNLDHAIVITAYRYILHHSESQALKVERCSKN